MWVLSGLGSAVRPGQLGPHTRTVLFVCVHNAGRSQMAAGFLAHYGGSRVVVRSAGSAPADRVNPACVQVLAEAGIDIGDARPAPLAEDAVRSADVIVTMGCGEAVPILPGKRYLDWDVEDPAGRAVDAVRRIRDELDRRVQALLNELLATPVLPDGRRPAADTVGAPTPPEARVRRRVVLLASLGLLLSGYNNFAIGLALVEVRPAFHLGAAASGVLAAATLFGMLIGSVLLGRLADRLGRRPALMVDLAIVVVFAVASGLVTAPAELIAARLLLGIGIGAGYPIGSSFVADVSRHPSRGRWMTLAFSGWGVGALLAALAGWATIVHLPPATGWRWLLAAGAVPAVVTLALVAIRGLPESPRWTATRGLPPLPMASLAGPQLRRRTLAALLPWFLMDVSVYGVGLFTPTLLQGLGLVRPTEVAMGTAALTVFTLVGFAIAGALIDRVGRRPLQIAGFVVMAATLAWLGLLGSRPDVVPLLALFAGFQLGSNAGPNVTTWIVPAELFPTRLRGTAQGAATAFSRIGAIVGVLALPAVADTAGVTTALLGAAACSVAGALLTARLLPETAQAILED